MSFLRFFVVTLFISASSSFASAKNAADYLPFEAPQVSKKSATDSSTVPAAPIQALLDVADFMPFFEEASPLTALATNTQNHEKAVPAGNIAKRHSIGDYDGF